jgi:acid phosphatase
MLAPIMRRETKNPLPLALGVSFVAMLACGSRGGGNAPGIDGGPDGGGGSGGGGLDAGPGDASGAAPGTGDGGFAPGTICNATGIPRTPPAKLKNIIVILFENENYGSVNGSANVAPYIDSLATQCGQATAYNDDCFTDNLVSLPHYLALTSGSNCNTGLDQAGTGCITDDGDPTTHVLTTTSIFQQVTSWKAYPEAMPASCAQTSSGEYAAKHNPAVYYSSLSDCPANDVTIAAVTCNPTTTNTPCTPAPSNAFTDDLANDTLPQFVFVTPSLLNDMHDGTITQADNWLLTYMPLIFASKAYLRGDVAVQLLWDEQSTAVFGGPTPNVFISPYIAAGTASSTPMNHFSMLRAWENALGISTYLGCASGALAGDAGTCPADSTADVRAALHW